MSTQQLVTKPESAIIEDVLIKGDLMKLTEQQRVSYYKALCESVGLNPLTQPFQYLVLNGKLTLYARKDCTDQLRAIHNVSVENLEHKAEEGLYIVTANVKNASGRKDAATGAVNIENLKDEAKANAIMKAETKAKRRATLSICGLGMLDETEIDSIPGAVPVNAIAADGKVGTGCEDCGKAIGDWKGEIDGREFSYSLAQIQVIARKLYEKDICGDCLEKRRQKRLSAAQEGAPDPTPAPSASMVAEQVKKEKATINHETGKSPRKPSKQTSFDPSEFITDEDTQLVTGEIVSPEGVFKPRQ